MAMMRIGEGFYVLWDIPVLPLIPDKVDIYFESKAGKLKIVENGVDTGYSEEKATEILFQEEVTAIADIKSGSEEATAWGCSI